MKLLIKIFGILLILIVGTILYSRYIATSGLITNEIVINDNNIPTSFDGLKIVHFSDLHYTRIITKERVNDIVEEINLINPDIVVFTGDLVDTDKVLTEDDKIFLIESLSNINSTYGKYAIYGNHDIANNSENIIDIYNKSNFKILDNDYDIIYSKNNDKIFVGGLNSVSHELEDINKVMSYYDSNDSTNTYNIILLHEPDYADNIVNSYDNINLIFAGHSHGGQVRLPIMGALYTPQNGHKYVKGYYDLNGTSLYVTSGIGVSRYNFRLFNKPEINFYRLNKEAE